MSKIIVDPLTRIEGHLKFETGYWRKGKKIYEQNN